MAKLTTQGVDKKYLSLIHSLGAARSSYGDLYGDLYGDAVWKAPYVSEYERPLTAPEDIENWYELEDETFDDNGRHVSKRYVSKKAVEDAYWASAEGQDEKVKIQMAKEQAEHDAEMAKLEKQKADDAKAFEERMRKAEQENATFLENIRKELEAQQKAFDDEREGRRQARRDSAVESAGTQLSALERIAKARETLVAEEPLEKKVEQKVVEEQETFLERLLKKGKN